MRYLVEEIAKEIDIPNLMGRKTLGKSAEYNTNSLET